MKAAASFALVVTSLAALPGCFMEPDCPAGQQLVRDGASGNDVCVARSYSSRSSSPSASASGSGSGASSPPSATPTAATASVDAGTAATPGSTGAPGAGGCGGSTAQSDSVRLVDKADVAPSLGNGAPSIADGSYVLVQASFYRTGSSASPIRTLKANLDVSGPTLTVNARDSSVAGLPDESQTFLVASGGVLTKTCESVHGSVAAWVFPFAVGATAQSQLDYDGTSRVVRLIMSRADGATELVFAR